ncbi:MAG: class I SAM-dependent methyltransferase [Deinococcales bacterium]
MVSIAFDEHAEKYDGWFMKNPNVLTSEVLLIKHSLADPGETLSVGCGSGLFELFLKRDHGIEITTGIEPSEAMADIARARGMDVTIAGAERIPFDDASFDTVLMNGIPAYLDDLGAPLTEARRVLRPGGRIVIGDVPASSSYGMLYRMAGMIGTWEDPYLQKVAPRHPYPVEFAGASFTDQQPVDARYRFNSWRATYRYRFDRPSGWQYWVGFTAKVRDAEIRLIQCDTVALDDDLGFVPLLHLAARYRINDRWSFDADFDGLAGGPGRAFDLGLRFNYHIDERWSLGLGYRGLEGGVDNDDVYNFAWFNSAVANLRLNF